VNANSAVIATVVESKILASSGRRRNPIYLRAPG
jgi:hypothetical protein